MNKETKKRNDITTMIWLGGINKMNIPIQINEANMNGSGFF